MKIKCKICGFEIDTDGFEYVEQTTCLYRFPGTRTVVNKSYAHADCFLGIDKNGEKDDIGNESGRDVVDSEQGGD